MSFPRYPKYKDSGVEWLGPVPMHWEARRVRWLFEIRKRIAEQLGFDVFSITQQGFRIKDVESNEGQNSQDYSKYQFVEPGEFAMNHMDLITGGVDIASQRGVTSPDYRVVAVRDSETVHDRYFLRVFQMCFRQQIFYAYGQGSSQLGRWRLPTDQFKDFVFPVPPKSEQERVAAFLDGETAKIDALVAEQQRLLELLKEKRQAVIYHAVTKGPNPNSPLKLSGAAWLGQLPEHWNIQKLRWLFEIRKRIAGTLGFDVLSITQQGFRVKDLESNEGQHSMDYSKYQLVEVGDFAMNHMDLLTGGVDIAASRGVTSPDYRVVRIRDHSICHEKYLLYLFQMCYRNRIFYAYGQGSSQLGRWRFPTEQFKDFVFPLPPKREQQSIAEFLDRETTKIDQLVDEAQRAIDLLQKRRTALISAAVTGQIDVRNLSNHTSISAQN